MSFNECKSALLYFNRDLNKNSNFFQFVYNKIARNSKDRLVENNLDSIDIIPHNHQTIKVIPLVKKMNSKKLFLDYEVKIASELIQNTDIKNIYFVYPKNSNFTKHTEVKVAILEDQGFEYKIKIIPYSLNDLYRGIPKQQRKTNGNSNILCK